MKMLIQSVLILFFAASLRAQEPNQYYQATGDLGLIVSDTQTVAQSFRPSTSGLLTSVELELARNPIRLGTFTFELHELTPENSFGLPILSRSINFGSVASEFSFLGVDLKAEGINVIADHPYAFALLTDIDSGQGLDPLAWHADSPGGYSSGNAFLNHGLGFSEAPFDMSFRLYVSSVPEPSPFAIFTLAGTLLALTTVSRARF
jgi:hypothetical protein